MEIKGFETVENLPALHHAKTSTVVISDLHLGLEGSMTQKGSYVPPVQLEDTVKEIEKLQKKTEADKIVINGDIKTEFATSRYSEIQEVKKLLDTATDNFNDVVLIKGNHDTFLDSTLKEYGLRFLEYHVSGKILYTHGHISLDNLEVNTDYDTVVVGHEHPALRLEDDVGIVEKMDCFLYGETSNGKDIIVLPAFSQIAQGTNINETPQRKLLSPILRENVNLDSLKAAGISRETGPLQFTEIGKLRNS